MRYVVALVRTFSPVLLLLVAGCDSGRSVLPGEAPGGSDRPSPYLAYAPAKVDIMPLTEFAKSETGENASQIKAYIGLLDAFNCQIKSPGTFRLELYEHIDRSTDPKGKRIVIWPDVDLTDPAQNNSYWRDFLRAYEFTLDFEPRNGRTYVLQVTCLCPNGKRLSDDFVLKYTQGGANNFVSGDCICQSYVVVWPRQDSG